MAHDFFEKEVVINGEVDISASITIPKDTVKKYPAIIIVAGSGPVDRDGNVKKIKTDMYKDLAEFLSGMGFVTIRYDKRGGGKSKGDYAATGMKDLAQDIVLNINYLKSLPYVDEKKIILLGHSEGCVLSTLISSQHEVAGMILIAGAGICLKTVLYEQNLIVAQEVSGLKGLKGKIFRLFISKEKLIAKQNKLFDKFEATNRDFINIQFIKQPAKWFREHFAYTNEDFLDMLNKTSFPVLAIAGDKDVQVNSDYLDAVMALGKKNITCHVTYA